MKTTIDSAGRLVLPKTVREEAGLCQVRIVQKGPLRIAMPVEEGPALSGTSVEQVRREIRASTRA